MIMIDDYRTTAGNMLIIYVLFRSFCKKKLSVLAIKLQLCFIFSLLIRTTGKITDTGTVFGRI
jgi:hypothetical protein